MPETREVPPTPVGVWLGLGLLVAVLDQLSKWLITSSMTLYESIAIVPMFNLTLVYNRGAAFSFLSEAGGWQRWFFAVLALVVSVGLVVWLHKLKRHEILSAFGLAMILGGAVGNLIDRVRLGYVIDFLDVYFKQWHWPAFNIADSAITVGVLLLLLDMVVQAKKYPAR